MFPYDISKGCVLVILPYAPISTLPSHFPFYLTPTFWPLFSQITFFSSLPSTHFYPLSLLSIYIFICLPVCLSVYLFETRSHYVTLTGLELTTKTQLA